MTVKYHGTCGRLSLMIDTNTPPASQVTVLFGDASISLSLAELEDLRYMIARSQDPQTRVEHERHK